MPSEKRHKTYKREAAVVLLLALGGVTYTGDIAMVQALVWPIMGFAAAAFGMDSVAAQWSDK